MKKIKIVIFFVIILTLVFTTVYEGRLFITTPPYTLDQGSKGSEVADLQQTLQNWGYYEGPVDGNYGWKTFLAVANYQKSNGLYSDGIAGSATLQSMGLGRIVKTGVAYAEGGGTSEAQLLARAINGEARGEPYEGQVAVGSVIINRTRDSRFPKTIPGVIYQPGAFTAVSDGQINVALDPNSTVVKAARDALNGWDPTYGCLYYWNPATATSKWIWSRPVVVKIGKHYFAK